MNDTSLLTFRFALLSGLGLLQACTPEGGTPDIERTTNQGRDGAAPSTKTLDGSATTDHSEQPIRDAMPGSSSSVSEPAVSVSNSIGPTPPIDAARDAAAPSVPVLDASVGSNASTAGSSVESSSAFDSGSSLSDETASETTDASGPTDLGCDDAQTVLASGAVQCSSGLIHRPPGNTCQNRPATEELAVPAAYLESVGMRADSGVGDASAVYPPPPSNWRDPETGTIYDCFSDAECAAEGHDYCVLDYITVYFDLGAYCVDTCTTDADCPSDTTCVCGEPYAHCAATSCKTDDECPAGELCAQYRDWCDAPVFACTSPLDECITDSDCLSDKCGRDETDTYRTCVTISCSVGRPFLVVGQVRTAAPVTSDTWLRRPTSESRSLDAALGPQLAAHLAREWTRIGLMEHASIAAFARFALQLLSLGAPPELLTATQRAMADETRHAQLAFSLASRFGNAPIGPGPLNVSDALDSSDLRSVTLNTFVEGCIGETVAALEAKFALDAAVDPEVTAALTTIVRDELAHAELAWRFVAWALELQPNLRQDLEGCLQRQLASLPTTRPATSALELAALGYGIAPRVEVQRLKRDVLRELVAPCLQAIGERAAGQCARQQRPAHCPESASARAPTS